MNKVKKPVGFIELGEYYGYPSCCIAEFLEFVLGVMMKKITVENPEKHADRNNRKLNYSGYIPCCECNKKTEKELINVINANRHPELPAIKPSEFLYGVPKTAEVQDLTNEDALKRNLEAVAIQAAKEIIAANKPAACECGTASVGGSKHSSRCPIKD